MSNGGFIKLNRGGFRELLYNDPFAYLLLSQVADRALRTDQYNVHQMEVGEALIGDHRKIGLTRRAYRTRIDRLVNAGFLTIKTTNRGTVAKLANSRVFDINPDNGGQQNGQQAASKRPPNGQQAATKEECKKRKNERMKEREEPLSIEEARALYRDDPRFAHKDVDGSLSKMFKEGKLQFPSAIEVWLERETKPRQKPKGGEHAGTWRDSNKAPSPPEQPVSPEKQAEFARELAELKAKAGLGKDGFKATGLEPIP
jgi:hypothetical protein